MKCPVCGHDDTACKGTAPVREREILGGVVTRPTGPARVPRIRSRVGRAGYVGEGTDAIEIYDPQYPHLALVHEPVDADEPDLGGVTTTADPTADTAESGAPKRSRRKKAGG